MPFEAASTPPSRLARRQRQASLSVSRFSERKGSMAEATLIMENPSTSNSVTICVGAGVWIIGVPAGKEPGQESQIFDMEARKTTFHVVNQLLLVGKFSFRSLRPQHHGSIRQQGHRHDHSGPHP